MILARIELERRRTPRLPCNLKVEVEGLSAPLTLSTRDVSRGGVFLYHRDPPPLDVPLDLRMLAPGRSLRVSGVVVHRIEGVGFGVRFDPAPDGVAEALERFLQTVEVEFAAAVQKRPPSENPPGETPTAAEDPSSSS
jgi:hypothetical protein